MSARNSTGGKAPRPSPSVSRDNDTRSKEKKSTALPELSQKHLARITEAVADAITNPLTMPVMLWWCGEDGPEYMAYQPASQELGVAFLVQLERLFRAPENDRASVLEPSPHLETHRQLIWAAQEWPSDFSRSLFRAHFGSEVIGSFASRFCFDNLSSRLHHQQCSC